MKRLIKFRAWNPEINKMFYDFDQGIKEVLLGRSIHVFIYETGLCFDTLMQFTGLLDKNGKEIYEGDILENPQGLKGKVVYDEAGFHLEAKRRNGDLWYMPLNKGMLLNKKVIGNIHENPELIKP